MLIATTACAVGYPAHVRMFLYILGFSLLFDGAKKCGVSLFEAAQKMEVPAVLLFAERGLFALLGLAAVTLYGTVTAIVLCYVAVRAIACFASLFLVRHKLNLKPERAQYNQCKKLTRYAFPFFAVSLTAALYADIDKLFLFSMQSASSVGIYSAAYKLVAIPIQFSNSFHRALYPLLSKHAAAKDKTLLCETYEKSMRYLTLGAIPIGVAMTIFAEPMIKASYGESYLKGTMALQILVWAYVLEFFNPFFSRVLYAIRRERSVLKAMVVGTACNVILNILLIPSYSFLGASIATLLSASVIFIILWRAVSSILPSVVLMKVFVKPLLGGLCMWGLCMLFSDMSAVVLIPLGMFVYCGCLVLTKAISTQELLVLGRGLRILPV
jgi:O-antigen/teichoic acid export membrane protein